MRRGWLVIAWVVLLTGAASAERTMGPGTLSDRVSKAIAPSGLLPEPAELQASIDDDEVVTLFRVVLPRDPGHARNLIEGPVRESVLTDGEVLQAWADEVARRIHEAAVPLLRSEDPDFNPTTDLRITVYAGSRTEAGFFHRRYCGRREVFLPWDPQEPGRTPPPDDTTPYEGNQLTMRILPSRLLWRRGVTVWCVDPAELAEAVTVRTSLVYVQTHGGTRAVAVDVATVAAACRASGAVLVVDATSASPAAVRPLTSGADVVVHTNADLLSGSRVEGSVALVASSNPALLATLERERERTASLPADSDVGLVSLGLRTLEGRLRTQQTTARRLVRFLASDPAVARVEYAGLARRGTGRERMLTKAEGIEIVFETLNPLAVRRVAAALRRFRPGLFDGTHSAVSIPATHGGRGFPEIERRVASGPLVIRLTIGLEPSDELLADLADALEASGVADTASTAPI
ncbi:MAG: PLP-dependent transferase [Phycisphaerales bacterium]|nr:PLP-dependent transferase [Phycisphaerales bacterium]